MAARFEDVKFRRVGVEPAEFSFAGNFTSRSEVVESWADKTVGVYEQGGGAITATITVEGSIDGNQFVPIGTPLTAAGFVLVPETVKLVRIVTTGHSAGDVRATVTGLDQRVGH